ncbi:uncharacterized protein EAE97_003186 [Botrytis byssoidea]|uniref:Uncharacterized protein n=1 Tax=Botrytis byssoidea TaxID=139641 RepID=A0A9P5IUZ5_9HELO|nr:uncharacterized protein EAE97_003186 [Botrytis byssoidea]KAF7949677.1 hypothetical protein EAE97_003186 [Botrytis byssoidea]
MLRWSQSPMVLENFDGHHDRYSARRRGRPVVVRLKGSFFEIDLWMLIRSTAVHVIHNNQSRTIDRANDGDVAIVLQEKLIHVKEEIYEKEIGGSWMALGSGIKFGIKGFCLDAGVGDGRLGSSSKWLK